MNIDWRHNLERWPGSIPKIKINAKKAAYIIVDMQNYYIREDGQFRQIVKNQFPDMEQYFMARIEELVIPNQQKLLEYFRANGLRVIYVRVGALLPDGSDQFARRAERDRQRKLSVKNGEILTKGTYQHEIIQELSPLDNELVLDKNSSSAFSSTMIDQFLRNFGVDTVVVGGILTNNCVESTARDAADRGYNVILVEDICATFEEEAHVATLRTFARGYGKVYSTKETLEILDESLKTGKEIACN